MFLDDVETPRNIQDPPFTFIVAELFNKLDATSKDNLQQFTTISDKKHYIIHSFISAFKTHIGLDFYPCSKLVFPDKAGRLYFIREHVLARLIVKMYNIPKESQDYQVLYNWKLNYNRSKRYSDEKNLRDLPLRASRIIGNRRIVDLTNDMLDTLLDEGEKNGEIALIVESFTLVLALGVKKSSLPVSIVNRVLDDLQNTKDQSALLKPLLDTLPIDEVRWILHIILKKTILGNYESTLFINWHPDAYKLFQICNNLQKTFNYLITPKRLNDKDLVLRPTFKFSPQLAHKHVKSYSNLVNQMKSMTEMDQGFQKLCNSMNLSEKFIIEEKMDGDRMVLHKSGKSFKFFSRRLKDYSFLYGENFEIGSLTKYLGNAFPESVDSVILDGEMVAWDYKRNVVLPFGTLKSSAIQESVRQYTTIDQYEQQSAYPYFLIFDILHLNGMNLTNHPLFFRKNILSKIIKPVPRRFEMLPTIYASSVQDLQDSIKKVVSSRSEGILVKHIQLKYFVGYRNHQWVKVKPEYLEKFGENLDLCVIGKIPAIKNSYLCGLKDENGVFQSFCTVANGFTVDDFDKIDRLTFGKWVDYLISPPPSNLIIFGNKKPKFWINPKDSIILEIKARAIDSQVEKSYAVGTTLHNLYCRSIREDKSINDATTLRDYRQMKEKYSENLEKAQGANKKKRKFNETSFEVSHTKVEIKSTLFENFNFIVASESTNNGERTSVKQLSNLIKKYGGHIQLGIDFSSNNQTLIITEKDVPVCKGFHNKGFDLIRPNYIFECIEKNFILQLEPCFIFKTDKLERFSSSLDEFNDSYIVHNDTVLNLPINQFVKIEPEVLKEMKDQLILEEKSVPMRYLFYKVKFFIVNINHNQLGFKFRVLEDRINRFGGVITTNFLEASYIVVPKDDNEASYVPKDGNEASFVPKDGNEASYVPKDDNEGIRKQILKEVDFISHNVSEKMEFMEESNSKIPNIVVEAFIDQCIKEGTIPDPDDYKFI